MSLRTMARRDPLTYHTARLLAMLRTLPRPTDPDECVEGWTRAVVSHARLAARAGRRSLAAKGTHRRCLACGADGATDGQGYGWTCGCVAHDSGRGAKTESGRNAAETAIDLVKSDSVSTWEQLAVMRRTDMRTDIRTDSKTCAACGKRGPIAEDETWPAADELALDARGLVSLSEYVCGHCLDRAEDDRTEQQTP